MEDFDKFIKDDDLLLDIADKFNDRGRVYALPIAVNFSFILANRDLLDDNDIGSIDNNWNWSEFWLLGKRMEREEKVAAEFGFSWEDAVYSNGSIIVDGIDKKDYLNTQRFINAINFAYRLQLGNSNRQIVQDDFNKSKIGFLKLYSSDYIATEDWLSRSLTLSMPAGPQGDNISRAEYIYVCISRDSNKKEEAWDFVRLLLSKELQSELINSAYAMPVSSLDEHELRTEKLRQIYGLSKYILPKAVTINRFEYDSYILDIIDGGIQAAYNSGSKISNTLSKLHIEVEKLMESLP